MILTAALKFGEFITCVGGNASANCRLMINADIYILLRSLILWASHRYGALMLDTVPHPVDSCNWVKWIVQISKHFIWPSTPLEHRTHQPNRAFTYNSIRYLFELNGANDLYNCHSDRVESWFAYFAFTWTCETFTLSVFWQFSTEKWMNKNASKIERFSQLTSSRRCPGVTRFPVAQAKCVRFRSGNCIR